MENEIRYYLRQVYTAMMPDEDDPDKVLFKPSCIVTAVKLPTGAIELATNTAEIAEKINYILSAYDEDMHLKANPDVVMQNVMIV